MNSNDKILIRVELINLVERIAASSSLQQDLVGNEVFLVVQRHWRNASKAQKNASYKHWDGICQKCKRRVPRDKAVFHHHDRGVADVHRPQNLMPEHQKCHDREHGVLRGSLSKGAPLKQPRKIHTGSKKTRSKATV